MSIYFYIFLFPVIVFVICGIHELIKYWDDPKHWERECIRSNRRRRKWREFWGGVGPIRSGPFANRKHGKYY